MCMYAIKMLFKKKDYEKNIYNDMQVKKNPIISFPLSKKVYFNIENCS